MARGCAALLVILVACLVAQQGKGDIAEELEEVKTILKTLARQLMVQQLGLEEQTRSTGDSGIKGIRLHNVGTRPYLSETHSSRNKIMAIHAHANNIRTVGMGEFTAVLNGVEFRTRHNDYGLKMPSTTSSAYHKTEEIPFPEVPPEVTSLATVEEQIAEMREWFRAFKEHNTTHRPYQQYFKPIICYLEGAWTTNTKTLDEPFESDRHFIDAENWQNLLDKIRYTSYTGSKDASENLAYLPTTIMDFINDTIPQLAQWNYRILCSPINMDLPLNRLRVVEDLGTRLSSSANIYDFAWSRAARFELNPYDQDEWTTDTSYPTFMLLDKIMYQVPGKDNYVADITDEAMGRTAYLPHTEEVMNAGYYHRVFKASGKLDAMGLSMRRRGYNDRYLFMAATTQPKIAPITYKCTPRQLQKGTCTERQARWSYAIPLEIIYLTPLTTWNPYGIEYKGWHNSAAGKTVSAGGRNGKSQEKAFNGTHSKKYYITPHQFFEGGEIDVDPADTVKGAAWFLGADGEAHSTVASGTRIELPNVPGVGRVRIRYPIMPVHGEGETVYKNLEALIDVVLEPNKYPFMYRGNVGKLTGSSIFTLKLGMSDSNKAGGAHEHWVYLSEDDLGILITGNVVTKETTLQNEHQHTIEIKRIKKSGKFVYAMISCSGYKSCLDGHPRDLIVDNLKDPGE